MSLAQHDPAEGIRVPSLLLDISAAATSGILWTAPTDGQTAIIRKLHIFSSDVANCNLTLGTGTTVFTAQFPKILVVAGMDRILTEDELIAFEFPVPAAPATAMITAQIDAHTSGSVTVFAELEMKPGSTVHA